jgi:hypothetical protein
MSSGGEATQVADEGDQGGCGQQTDARDRAQEADG